jgi:hypothetical protein
MDAPSFNGPDDRDSRPEDRPDPIWLVCASCDGAEEFATVDEGLAAGWKRVAVQLEYGGTPGRVSKYYCPLCDETRDLWGDK